MGGGSTSKIDGGITHHPSESVVESSSPTLLLLALRHNCEPAFAALWQLHLLDLGSLWEAKIRHAAEASNEIAAQWDYSSSSKQYKQQGSTTVRYYIIAILFLLHITKRTCIVQKTSNNHAKMQQRRSCNHSNASILIYRECWENED